MKRFLAIGALGLALLAGAVAWTFLGGEGPGKKPASTAAKQEARLAVAPPPPLPGSKTQQTAPAYAAAPSFDVVRIKPTGDAVIAGRAVPGAEVTILDGARELGKVVADAHGEWVFLPPGRLPPGARELSLSARNPDGTASVSSAVVVLHVPEPGAAPKPEEAAVAVVTPREGGASRVLQAPPPAADRQSPSPVAVDVVDYDENGQLILSGRSAPGADVLVYLNDRPLGRSRADGEGKWQLRAEHKADPGDYRLRADQVTPQGKVVARIEMPFTHADLSTRFLDPARGDRALVVVQPGDSLWRISRFHFGRGILYTVIYQANQGQIRDPDLIYPGQVFAVPSLN